jgi:hypothetical protein
VSLIDGLVFGLPAGFIGEQIVQVPGGLKRNFRAREACIHVVIDLCSSWWIGRQLRGCSAPGQSIAEALRRAADRHAKWLIASGSRWAVALISRNIHVATDLARYVPFL